MTKPGIVIVTHNSEGHIGACLEAARRWATEVIVVDNASADGTQAVVRRLPEVRLVANQNNRGFAAAVNQGIALSSADSALLLNPDAELLSGLDSLVEALQDRFVGAAAGKLVDCDGNSQSGFNVRRFPTPATLAFEVLGLNRIWPSNPVNRRYRCYDFDPNKEATVEQPAGAFLLLKRSAWSQLGGLDESFHPLWFEDVDYLRRLTQSGFTVRYVPQAVARHVGGHSITKLSRQHREVYWYGSLLRYASKHFSRRGRGFVSAAVVTGSCLRMVAGVLADRAISPIVTYGKVMKIAGKTLLTRQPTGSRTVTAAAAVGPTKLWNQQ